MRKPDTRASQEAINISTSCDTVMVTECSFCGKPIGMYNTSFAVTFEESVFVNAPEEKKGVALEVLEADEFIRWCQYCNNTLILNKKQLVANSYVKELIDMLRIAKVELAL